MDAERRFKIKQLHQTNNATRQAFFKQSSNKLNVKVGRMVVTDESGSDGEKKVKYVKTYTIMRPTKFDDKGIPILNPEHLKRKRRLAKTGTRVLRADSDTSIGLSSNHTAAGQSSKSPGLRR